MDKVKEKLHLRRKSKPENDASALHRASGEGTHDAIPKVTLHNQLPFHPNIFCWRVLSLREYAAISLYIRFLVLGPGANSSLLERRGSVDSELEAMTPAEREAYLKEFDEAERTGEPKKGSLIDKLIARGNKRTEDQIARETADKQAKLGNTGPAGGKSGVVR